MESTQEWRERERKEMKLDPPMGSKTPKSWACLFFCFPLVSLYKTWTGLFCC